MNIAIIDDTAMDLRILETALKEYGAVNSLDLTVSAFDGAEAFLADYRPLQYSAVFLDIYMNGLTGIEAAEKIRECDKDTTIIFLTTSTDHMPAAFSVHAYDYITKPVSTERIFRVMDDVLRRQTETNASRLSFSSSKKDYSIPYSDIIAVQTGAKNYVEVIDSKGVSYKTRMTFSGVSEILTQDPRFLLILRGILVNMDYVTGFSQDTCRLTGGLSLPIAIKSGKKIEQIWRNYTFNRIRWDSQSRGNTQ